MHIGSTGRPKKHYFHELAFVRLSKSCFPPRAGSIFSKNRRMFCKKKCSKQGRHKEKSRSYTKLTKLLQWCIHSFLLTGLWGRKTHRTAARSNILKRAWSEKIAIGTAKRAKRANQMTKNALIEAVWGSKKWNFQSKVHEIVLQNCAPRRGRNNIFEKMWCKKWVGASKIWKTCAATWMFDSNWHQWLGNLQKCRCDACGRFCWPGPRG